MSKRVALASLISLITCAASAQTAPSIEQQWREFQRNPRAFMNMNPLKYDSNGRVMTGTRNSYFSENDVRTRGFVDKKSSYRLGTAGTTVSTPICTAGGICLDDVIAGRSAAQFRVEDWLDADEFRAKGIQPVTSLEAMQTQNLMSATLTETPWSDTYWPIAEGILGVRYASSQFISGRTWKARYDLLQTATSTLKAVATRNDATEVNSLSPSEKYDLLIGDLSSPMARVYDSGYLTPTMWREGQSYFDSSGTVEEWMGICHGWAVAASMAPRPTHSIKVKSADGRQDIKFYPSDLKGLASYLWAKTEFPTSFLGGRCNTKTPPQDPTTGRILDEACFDTNPGNWHVAIVNQIGLAKRSFVLDATYDYEVWNQPVHSYSYQYFNPQTGQHVATLAEATVERSAFTNDKFARFRDASTKKMVGIRMDVTYVVETTPNHRESDSAAADRTQSVSYMYDLELNDRNQIIGGEWYSNAHPDFIWMPKADARALAYGDSQLTQQSWTPGQEIPRFWRDIAIQTATRHGQPVAAIVEPLLRFSHSATAPAQ